MKKNKSILIIGGAGFIGSHLAKELLASTSDTVTVLDDLSVGRKEFLPRDARIRFFERSILREREIDEVFGAAKPDVVYHMAAKCFLPSCAKAPQGTMTTNVVGTEIVVRMCNKHQAKHLVFASSCEIYGISPDPLSEDRNIAPLEIYGLSKLLGEVILKEHCEVPWTACRFFPVYGNDMTQEYLIPVIIKQMHAGNELLLGNLTTKRDYVHISDVARALRMMANNSSTFGEAFNIGSGTAYSGNELVAMLESAFHKKSIIRIDPARMRKSDNPCICADISKIKKIIGWSPEITLQKGLATVLKGENILQ